MNLFKTGAVMAVGIALGAAGTVAAQAVLPAPNGPQQSQPLGSIDLTSTNPNLAGYTLNLRRAVIPPGAGLAPHSHKTFPEIAFIESGVLSDQRNGGPITMHGPGSVLLNTTDVTHALLNQGSEPVVMFATSVAPTKPKPAAAQP
jgi:quercetin dioxygenase-like cupin family protein